MRVFDFINHVFWQRDTVVFIYNLFNSLILNYFLFFRIKNTYFIDKLDLQRFDFFRFKISNDVITRDRVTEIVFFIDKWT